MTKIYCPKCRLESKSSSKIHRQGSYYRTSDSKWIQRYKCVDCSHSFSNATFQSCYKQKKRHKNEALRKLLSSGISLRRAAILLHIHRITVVRKFLFLGIESEYYFNLANLQKKKAISIQFDDLETFEKTKYKPLSVTLSVETDTRRILGIEVSQMAAKGLHAYKAKKYGHRKDERKNARRRLLKKLQQLTIETPIIQSDSNPYYRRDVKHYFSKAKYVQYIGARGAGTGQGELKKLIYDPLFSLNHTCAMLRANINRLFRKTWCTTKKKECLYAHLMIYARFHNETLI
ncbi:MAG: transposase [Oligoflexia bacterium]|nr:transposase [Oligoflexia bacterium]